MEDIRQDIIKIAESLNEFSKVSTSAITDIYAQLERIEKKVNLLEEKLNLFSTISRLDEK